MAEDGEELEMTELDVVQDVETKCELCGQAARLENIPVDQGVMARDVARAWLTRHYIEEHGDYLDELEVDDEH